MFKVKEVLFKPFTQFLQLQASSSILLLGAAILAIIWANSSWAELYRNIWETHFILGIGPFRLDETVHFWINDGLMAIFFLVVGLEIKRELLVGELSSPRHAALPIAAALGGVLLPACIYIALHPPGSEFARGWGIPTVTDIAFAIGVLTVLGDRVPLGLKVFLTALAIVDDVAAILLIAIFYSDGLHMEYIFMAGAVMGLLLFLNRAKVDQILPYVLLGAILWFLVLKTGVHPTIAGVLLAMMIPSVGKIDPAAFYAQGQVLLERFAQAGIPEEKTLIMTNPEHQASVQGLEIACEEVQAPLQKIEHGLHPWVSYLILPLFALANAGVQVNPVTFGQAILNPVTIAIILGLFIGKQSGITLFAWLAVRLKLAELPQGVDWKGIYGASILGGIGFTVALFMSVLAFKDPVLVDSAKLGVLLSSVLSAAVGVFVLCRFLKKPKVEAEKPITPAEA